MSTLCIMNKPAGDEFDGFDVGNELDCAEGFESEVISAVESLLSPPRSSSEPNGETFTPLPGIVPRRCAEVSSAKFSYFPRGRISNVTERRTPCGEIAEPDPYAQLKASDETMLANPMQDNETPKAPLDVIRKARRTAIEEPLPISLESPEQQHAPPLPQQNEESPNPVIKNGPFEPDAGAKTESSVTLETPPTALQGHPPGEQSNGDSVAKARSSKVLQPLNENRKQIMSVVSAKPILARKQEPGASAPLKARPVSRCQNSQPSVVKPPVCASVVLEECNGRTQKRLINNHVGVPQSHRAGVRKVEVKPFSFVERDEIARQKREEKLRQAYEESLKFSKFTANPLPSYLAKKPKAVCEAPAVQPDGETGQLSNKTADEKENVPQLQ